VKNKKRVIVKRICHLNVRGFILAAAFSAALGFGTSASAQPHSYLVDLNSKTATDIGTLGGSYSVAQGINDAGQVVGRSGDHAFITGPDGMGMRDLGTLGGDYSYSEASGINDAGQVVGRSGDHAFITGPDGMGMRDLGTLGGRYSEALGINDAGQVVGRSPTVGVASYAFITGPDGAGMMDLNSLVDLPGGAVLTSATGINNSGQVVALGTHPGAGDLCALSCGPGPSRVNGAANEDESCGDIGLGSGELGVVAKHSLRMPMLLS
jgi:probable HAF family extracellular repeat protein